MYAINETLEVFSSVELQQNVLTNLTHIAHVTAQWTL